jgi:FG-GAP-like repeat
LQNTDGRVALWEINGSGQISESSVVSNPGPNWHVAGTGDFNNDGKTDIVLQNENGSVRVWEMQGTTIAVDATVPPPTGMTGAASSWNVLGTDSMRFINSGSANEVLAATPTTPDEFVFKTPAAGLHTITGFDLTHDVIELSAAHFANFGVVQAAMAAAPGGSTSINLGGSSSLLLSGVSKLSLLASNFALT